MSICEPATPDAAALPQRGTHTSAASGVTAVHPFRGLLLEPHEPGGMHALIGPPGDLPTPDAADAFLRQRRSVENAVLLELEDAEASGTYYAARDQVMRWMADGRLRQDEQPAYYLHEQRFVLHGVWHTRRALYAAVDIDGSVPILPHEGIWEANVERRLRVLRDVQLDVNPLVLLYEQAAVGPLLDELSQRQPDVTAYDIDGGVNRVWRVDAAADIRRVGAALQMPWLVIADGHHRHAAALRFQAECADHGGRVLAACVEVADPGLLVLPIHRVVTRVSAARWAEAAERLAAWFDCEMLNETLPLDRLDQVLAQVGPPQFIAVRGDAQPERWTLRSWAMLGIDPATAAPEATFDARVISDLLLEQVLGVDEAQVTIETDAVAAVAAAQEDADTLTLLLRAPEIAAVIAVATADRRVPPKTTSFMPKPPVGLVLHDPLQPGSATAKATATGADDA